MGLNEQVSKIKDAKATPEAEKKVVAKPETNAKAKAKGTSAETTKHEVLKAQGHAMGENLSEEQKQFEGSRSGAVAFIRVLGNPKVPQSRKQNGMNIPSFQPVGYECLAKEDITVYSCPLKADATEVLAVDTEIKERAIKAGETFNLNLFEAGATISRSEFGGRFSGGEYTVTFDVKYAADRVEPLPILRRLGVGSIKETMELIATKEEDALGKDVFTLKTVTNGDSYDQYAPLLVSTSKGGNSTGNTAPKTDEVKAIARAFSNVIASRIVK